VIFLSARGEVVDKVRGLSCGAADYITKPFQAAELLARIDAVPGQARNPRAPRLGRPIDRGPGERLVARVAVADAALREHIEKLLLSRFDLADADDTPDVAIVEGNAALPADLAEDVAAAMAQSSCPSTLSFRGSSTFSFASAVWTTTFRPRRKPSSCSRPRSAPTTAPAPGTESVSRHAPSRSAARSDWTNRRG